MPGFESWSAQYAETEVHGTRGYYGEVELASWARRVPGALIDWGGYALLNYLTHWWFLAAFVIPTFFIFMNNLMQGFTGQSIGKRLTGLVVFRSRFSRERGTWVPTEPGPWVGLGRLVCHIIDHAALYLGWFRPLWNADRQTWADSLTSCYVCRVGDVTLVYADGPVDR